MMHFKNEKGAQDFRQSWQVIHVQIRFLPTTMRSKCQLYSALFTMHPNRHSICFSAKVESNQVHQCLFFSQHTVVLSTSLLVSSCWAFGQKVNGTQKVTERLGRWKTAFLRRPKQPEQEHNVIRLTPPFLDTHKVDVGRKRRWGRGVAGKGGKGRGGGSWATASSKHWFTTSFLQPLPYLVTP